EADIDADGEPLLKADLLDLQVAPHILQLLGQRHFLFELAIEREAEKLAEARQHRVRRLDIAVHQRGDRIERIEEEVRLELHPQRLQLRARQLARQLSAAQLAIAALHVEVERQPGEENHPVRRQARLKIRI